MELPIDMCIFFSTWSLISMVPILFLGKHYSETCYDKEVWMMNVSFQSDRIVTCFMTIKFLSLSRMRINCAWKPYADCGFSKTSWPNGRGNKFLNIPEWAFQRVFIPQWSMLVLCAKMIWNHKYDVNLYVDGLYHCMLFHK